MFTKKNDAKKDRNKDLDLKLKLFAELVRLWAHADAYYGIGPERLSVFRTPC